MVSKFNHTTNLLPICHQNDVLLAKQCLSGFVACYRVRPVSEACILESCERQH